MSNSFFRFFLGFVFLVAAFVPSQPAVAGALETYLQQPDSSFTWKANEQRKDGEFNIARLEMTSQTWRSNVWTHHMIVVRPETVRNPHIGFLFITGDGDGLKNLDLLKTLAGRAGAVAAEITRVPNQPLYDGRKEDALIAYTFAQYLKTGDETWPLLFPMVKSAVRGMDTVQAFAQKTFDQKIEQFVVSGASKRGWTTWLAAATDSRVTAMAPMVIDMLNMKVQTDWAKKVYGKQSEQIRDYEENDLLDRGDDPAMKKLRGWVDPYSYRARFKMPKLLLLGANDPYWTVDALRNYWDDLPEPKLIFQTPNAGHDLGGGKEAIQTLAAFFQMIADGQPLPKMNWKIENNSNLDASVRVTVSQPVKTFRLWTSESPERDFRKQRWSSRDLARGSEGREVSAAIEKPATGHRAFLVEAELTSSTGHPYKLSTEARVAPDDIK